MLLTPSRDIWATDFEVSTIENLFYDEGSSSALILSAGFSLSWFVEKFFNNQHGRPLRLMPFQMVILDMLWHKKFPMIIATRGSGKTFLLALYALLRAILVPGSKIIICGAGFRQAKQVFRYIDTLYKSSPIIQEAIRPYGGPKYASDNCYVDIGLSVISAIPIGDGEKIRGLRATVLLADEFAAIPEEIFEIVIAPFTAVHADPAAKAAVELFIKRIVEMGADDELIKGVRSTQDFGNQIVISGTASYRQNHFFKRFQSYQAFIKSEGDPVKLRRALESRALAMTGKPIDIPEQDVIRMASTWGHYAVMQLPYTALPPGFLDEDTIRLGRAAFAPHRFSMEFEAKFPKDTDGFFKRSMIDDATPKDSPHDDCISVPMELFGDSKFPYVLGLDPARWNDNFGAVVLKLTPRGEELVYCSAWNKTEWKVSAKKVRDICRRFPIEYIAMDKEGGGGEMVERLSDIDDKTVEPNELMWPIAEQLETKRLMSAPGRRIIELVNFTSWSKDANYSLQSAITNGLIFFPYKGDDALVLSQLRRFLNRAPNNLEEEQMFDLLWGIDEETLDAQKKSKRPEEKIGLFNHIMECINEACAIVRDVTPGGTERFELPKMSEQPEGLDLRRRDRYSALLLAHYAARRFRGHGPKPANNPGMVPGAVTKKSHNGLSRRSFKRKGNAMW